MHSVDHRDLAAAEVVSLSVRHRHLDVLTRKGRQWGRWWRL